MTSSQHAHGLCVDSGLRLSPRPGPRVRCWVRGWRGQEVASRSHGKHKQRVWLWVCSTGLKIVDEKTRCVMYEHDASRISSLRRDESDPRALAYVFQHQHSYTLFYIKMANMADPVLDDIQEVCQGLDQVSPEEPTQTPTQNNPLLLLDENDVTLPEALHSNDLADIFTTQLDEPATANQNAASSQPGSPQPPHSTAQILSNFFTPPVVGSPYSSPTTMGPWGLAGPFASLSPPTTPQWGGGGAAPWPSHPGTPAAWAPASSIPGPVGAPMQAYGPPQQHQQQQPGVPWGQNAGMYPSTAPTPTHLYSGPPSSGGARAPAPPQQLFPLSGYFQASSLMLSKQLAGDVEINKASTATSAPEIGEPTPESPGPASFPEGVSVGLRRSSKYSFH
ncbi:Disabled 2 [Merluccius polli]|uniref:Disabled 2 n=1 Tax=Merluccius polli TaxID=89951 RepID=A0AA47P385_MERPO|nr:Disabled 2 [Merluccius polli]